MTSLAPHAVRVARAAKGSSPVGGESVAILAFVALVVVAVLASSGLSAGAQLLVVVTTVVVALLVPAAMQARRGADMTPFLLAPTVLSAFQNVYLLPVAPVIAPGAFPVIIITNFVVAVLLLGLFAVVRPVDGTTTHPLARLTGICLGVLTVWGWGSALVFGADLNAALSSFRNIVTPLVFLLLGLLAARSTRARAYAAGLLVVAVLTIAFGFWELNAPSFWQDAGILELWHAKAIGIREGTGLPGNFYSSELIDGQQARRMVSSFADPVHFGTFLFSAFLAAVWLRRWIVAGLCIAAACFAISKGFLLSTLVLVAVWARVYANPVVQALAVIATVGAGAAFYVYASGNSTGSTDVHIDGFLAAFTELPRHPIGRGLGNSGVRARVLLGSDDSEVTESGIGLIVSQLGVIGAAAFAVFFIALLRAGAALRDRTARLVAVGLALAFLLNAAFNEVALSPNSAAPYFILIGLVIGADQLRRPAGPEPTRGTPWK
jgi:hypothetical protein